ncbi:flagellar biosynthesis protein FlhF [Azospirillum sp. A39]|uniref:flagellar biosynthesis protein FlhF n=1 Tax=Azospirillum sp. A39 TaxID=3462279 RepID=UPI004045DFEE
MRLKSFHAKSMSEAMRQVRQTLGDDAIIVATREEEGGGVRVTAAVEEEDHGQTPARTATAPAKPAEPEVDVSEAVADALHRHGVPAVLAEQLIDAAAGLDTDDPTLALGAALDAVFTFHPLSEGRPGQKPLVLVGPPGSGKTLTVAKLAARAVFKSRTVSVITTDTVRAGGVDQLAAFMRLMKVRLHTVEDPEALHGAIAMSRESDLIVVDTAGRNPFDGDDMADLKALIGGEEVEPVLVLPAGIDAVEASEVGQIFRSLGVRRMLVTRLDATRRLGSILTAAFRARLALCDCTVAPKVAEGLTALNPVALARMMMPAEEAKAKRPPPAKAKKTKASATAHALSSPSSRTLP